MSVRRWAVTAAVIAGLGGVALAGGPAPAATYLRTDPGGALLSGSTLLGNTSSDRAVLATGTGTFTCLGTSFTARVTENADAFGSVNATLTSLGLTSCAADGAPVNFSSCALHAGSPLPSVQLFGGVAAGTVQISGIVERCAVQSSSSACYYTQVGTATGTFTNATSALDLPSIALTRATTTTDGLSAAWCGEAGTLSTTVTDVVQQSTGTTLTVTAPPPPPPPPTAVRTDPGGGRITGATTLTNTTSTPAVFQSGIGTVTCTQTSFAADLSRNFDATTPIAGSLTALTFTSCTDTIPFIAYTSCHSVGAPPVSITANATGGHVRLTDVLLRCAIASSTNACYLTAATATGTEVNATSSLTYANIGFIYPLANPPDGLGSLPCMGIATGDVLLTHIVQAGTNRTVTLTTA